MMQTTRVNPYYRRRKIDAADYEQYWKSPTDPDGKQRDRIKDKHQYLEDIAAEIAWLYSLQPGRVLDIGCGFGWLLEILSDEWDAVGVEISDHAANIAVQNNENITVCVGQFPNVTLQPAAFDVIICHHVIEHLASPCKAMEEINRLAKANAKLLMATPDFASPCAQRFGAKYRMLHDPTHCSLFTNESMHRFLRDYGWTIDAVDYPFPKRYDCPDTWSRWRDTSDISPPWPGNWMTFYCTRA